MRIVLAQRTCHRSQLDRARLANHTVNGAAASLDPTPIVWVKVWLIVLILRRPSSHDGEYCISSMRYLRRAYFLWTAHAFWGQEERHNDDRGCTPGESGSVCSADDWRVQCHRSRLDDEHGSPDSLFEMMAHLEPATSAEVAEAV